MKMILKLEELTQMAAALLLLNYIPVEFNWWAWILLFLSPDISILGYAFNTRTGAAFYNLFHHKGIAVIISITGFAMNENYLLLAGLILFAHSCFDRIWGYGLKLEGSFQETHLGRIGRD